MDRSQKSLRERLDGSDDWIIGWLDCYDHRLHRLSLGGLFVWLGLLKPMGHKTATSLLAETVYWGSPEAMVLLLGGREVAIGVASSWSAECSCYSSLDSRDDPRLHPPARRRLRLVSV